MQKMIIFFMVFGLVNQNIAMNDLQHSKKGSAKVDEEEYEMLEEVINPVEGMMLRLSEEYSSGKLVAVKPDEDQFQEDLLELFFNVRKEEGPVFNRLQNALINEYFYNMKQVPTNQKIISKLCSLEHFHWPALCSFVKKPYPTLAALGIYTGGNVNAAPVKFAPCVNVAILMRHDLLANLLIQKGADISLSGTSRSPSTGLSRMSSLHNATYHTDLHWMTVLLKKNRDLVSFVNGEGQTPLHCVVNKTNNVKSDTELFVSMQQIQLLLQYGADPTCLDNKGRSAMYLAQDNPPIQWVFHEVGYAYDDLSFLKDLESNPQMQSILDTIHRKTNTVNK